MSLDIKEILDLMRNPTPEDEKRVREAFVFASEVHSSQTRLSGEPYIIHPFETAKILASFQADTDTIVAGLLHDTIEDCSVSQKEIEEKFGPTVAFLVDGVSKLGKVKYQGLQRHAESLRKFFVAVATDVRALLVRLADRLHNVRTLEFVPKEKQRRIAIETLEIYAPLANRLGIGKMKGMLEDASFPFAYPKEYEEVSKLRKAKGKETLRRLEKTYRTLQKELVMRGLENIKVEYRIKYLYSLYEKLKKHDMNIEQIYDISALRVITKSLEECYQILGLIHSLWRPVPGRLKDYIANPKPNGYQSIHTSVFIGEGQIAEVQIRTQEMHKEAEFGLAAHVFYDEQGKPKKSGPNIKSNWVKDILNLQKESAGTDEFLRSIKTDFLRHRIFVFTPKGDVVELPEGSTPLDFAYAIHSDIGDHAASARINGKMSSLGTVLSGGEIIEIETKNAAHPSSKWLELVKTSSAQKKIRSALSEIEIEQQKIKAPTKKSKLKNS